MTRTHRAVLRLALVSALAGCLTGGLTTATTAAPPGDVFPSHIDLPDGFQPEGIALGPGPTAWFGSRVDGDIYEVDLRTGDGEVISQGPGTASVGMKSDRRGRLFVAGDGSGTARVVDTDTGELLADYVLTDQSSFVNDVVLTKDAAWFTDSFQAQLYRLPLSPSGALPAQDDVETIPLGDEWEQGAGFGANGITETPDGDALLVVHSTSGLLYRVDPATGDATVVDLGGELLTNGDGMLLVGRTLYVVRNQDDLVAVVELDRDGTSGTVTREITSPDFDVPTTVAKFGRSLYLPNARFTTPAEPDTPYWVTRVDAR
jgi:sugar lactone lactonase YvrE